MYLENTSRHEIQKLLKPLTNKNYSIENAISMELTAVGTELDVTEKPKYLPSRSDKPNYLNQSHRNKHSK